MSTTLTSHGDAESRALEILERQNKDLTAQLQTLTSERDEYRDALSEVTTERDSLRGKPEHAARIAELEAAIRDRDHFAEFSKMALESKAKAKALRQLWRDAKDRGYKPESDEVDEKALQATVARLKSEVDYAFDADSEEATKAAQENARKPTSRTKYGLDVEGPITPGGGRSAERNKGTDGTIITQEMRADPKFMLDPKNRELIRDAALGGRFR